MEQNTTTTKSIHQQLKEIAAKELEGLPELLDKLEPKERVRAILSLLPYTAPKIENCTTHFGEPVDWDL